MIALYFLLSALIALAAAFARQRRTVKRLGAAFYLVQLSLVAHIVAEGYGEVSSQFSSASTRQARSSSRC